MIAVLAATFTQTDALWLAFGALLFVPTLLAHIRIERRATQKIKPPRPPHRTKRGW